MNNDAISANPPENTSGSTQTSSATSAPIAYPKRLLRKGCFKGNRNTHAQFSHEVYGYAPKGPGNKPKKIIRAYIAWMFSKIANGERVSLPGLGTIHATFRKERFGVGSFKAYQAAQFVLKISPSPGLKPHLIRLAKEKPDSFK
jgi:nucleoid DNA-binding protein